MGGQPHCGWRARCGVLQAPQPGALCQSHARPRARSSRRLRCVHFRGDTANSAPERQRRGPKGGRQDGEGPPEMWHPQGLRGLALPAPLRRFCSHCASRAAPGSGRSRDLHGWRRAGRRDGDAGNRFLPPTRTATPQCPPCAPTLARGAGANVPGESQLARGPGGRPGGAGRRKRGGEARLDLSSVGGGAGGGSRWFPEPRPGRPPAAAAEGTYLDPLLRLGEGGLGGRLGLQGLKSFQTERGTSHLRSPVSTRAPGRRDEVGSRCRRRRSALPAPSRRRCSLSPPRPPLPSPPLPCGRWSVRRAALAAEDLAAVPAPAQVQAGASGAAGVPSAPHLLWPLRPRRGCRGAGAVSYLLKITDWERWVSPSLPTMRPGEGLG